MHKLIFIALIFSFFSCNRDEAFQTTVNGKVIDIENYSPIAGATVYFMKQDQSNPGVYIHFHSTTTDADGRFSHSFTAQEKFNYYTYATYQNYLINDFINIPYGQTNLVNILLTKPGFMAIHVKNTSPFNSSDQINIFDSDYLKNEHIFNGNTVDTTIVITSYGNQTHPVKWKVTKNDTTITYNQAFNFIAFDTLSFDLFY